MSTKLRESFDECRDYSEIERKLVADGWIFRGINGSHAKWQNPRTNKCIIVPSGHGKNNCKNGTLHAIIRQIALACSIILAIVLVVGYLV